MHTDYLLQVAREGLFLVILVSAPVVLVSLVVGLLVSLLQATTQLQDHTISFVPKLLSVLLALAIAAPWIGAQLMRFTQAVLGTLHTIQ